MPMHLAFAIVLSCGHLWKERRIWQLCARSLALSFHHQFSFQHVILKKSGSLQ